jgi:hypothetical protein
MPQMVDEAGNIWEVDAQGNPVAFVGKQGAQQGPVTIGTPNPNKQRGDALDNQYKEAQINKIIADMSKEDAPKLPTGYRMKADGSGAELIPGVAAPGANAKGDPGKAGAYKSVIQQIDRLYELYNQGIGATEGVAGILDYLPTEANAMFDTAGAALGDQGNAAFKVPGMGAQSDADAARFVAANQPMASDRDAAALEKLRALRQRLEANMQAQGLPAPQWNYDLNGAPISAQPQNDQSVAGALPAQGRDRSNQSAVLFGGPGQDGGGGGFAPYGATMKTEANPQWKGVNQAVKGMIVAGRSPDEIKAFLNSKGIAGDAARGVDEAINYFRKTGKDNFGVDVEKIQVPMSGTEQFLNNAPQTRVGTAAATALNAGGFGIPQMLAGGQGLDYLRSQNPGSAFAGDVAGVIGGTAALGRAGGAVAGRVAPNLLGGGSKAALGRQLATDATYGGIYGATTEGDPLTGAATAALGSGLGMGIGKGIQKGLTGVTDPAVQYLTQRGIPLTMGQTLGNRGVIGKTMNKLESLPVLGDMMGARRLDGLQAFEREALKDVVAPVGGSVTTGGAEGLAQAQGAVSQAYRDALSGVNVSPDQQFIQEAGQAMQTGAAVPKFGEDFTYAMNQEVGPLFGHGGNLSGPQLQSALQSIGKIRSGFGKNPDAMASYAADAAGQLDDALSNLVGRQAPDVMPAYNDAKGAFSRLAPFEKARIGAINQEAITPAQLLRAVTSNTNKFGGRAAAARGDNLTDLMRYGQDVLPSTVPNSGTADRGLAALFLPAALGGGAAYSGLQENPGTAGLLATLAAMSTKTGQKALQKALTSRPGSVRKAGGLFGSRKAQRAIGGAITAPLLIE